MNLYNYCTRCGNELTTDERIAYERADTEYPPLCGSCVEEIFGAISDIAETLNGLMRSALKNTFEALEETTDDN